MKTHVMHIAEAPETRIVEGSAERFDRVAFAARALRFVRTVCDPRVTVGIGEGSEGTELRVEIGRAWGRPGERWAMLVIPPRASRRAIALAVMEIAGTTLDAAYAVDVLMNGAIDRVA